MLYITLATTVSDTVLLGTEPSSLFMSDSLGLLAQPPIIYFIFFVILVGFRLWSVKNLHNLFIFLLYLLL